MPATTTGFLVIFFLAIICAKSAESASRAAREHTCFHVCEDPLPSTKILFPKISVISSFPTSQSDTIHPQNLAPDLVVDVQQAHHAHSK